MEGGRREDRGALCQCGVGAAEGVAEAGSRGEGSWAPTPDLGAGEGGAGWAGPAGSGEGEWPAGAQVPGKPPGEKRLEGEVVPGCATSPPTGTDGAFLLQRSLPLSGGWVCPFPS